MRKGFTIIELLVVVAIIGLLVAILLPAIGKARDNAQMTQSQSNLRNIGQAAAIYGSEFQDRQWTACADDIGTFQGDCTRYANRRCSPQLTLGFDPEGVTVGFFIPQANGCGTRFPGATCDVGRAYWPCDFNQATGNFGSWRLINAKSFNKYVGGSFYSDVFYAPKDRVTIEAARRFKEEGTDYAGTLQDAVLSSYVWSPAAMWAPDVLSSRNGFVPPQSLPGAFRSPTSSQARFSDLKTRVIEHQWLQNLPSGLDAMTGSKWGAGEANPDSFSPASRSKTMPWYFNEGYMSSPNALFFDSHVAQLGVQEAIDSNNRVSQQNQSATNLAQRGTFFPKGAISTLPSSYQFGAYDNGAYNNNRGCGYHVFTVDGILGRDTVGAK
jgi:prepilin-type N-terminal cleavage/methylation domain-containing protein